MTALLCELSCEVDSTTDEMVAQAAQANAELSRNQRQPGCCRILAGPPVTAAATGLFPSLQRFAGSTLEPSTSVIAYHLCKVAAIETAEFARVCFGSVNDPSV